MTDLGLVAFSNEEHKRDFKLSDVILGGQDGLVNVLGVILGAAVVAVGLIFKVPPLPLFDIQ